MLKDEKTGVRPDAVSARHERWTILANIDMAN
jgi:hypothetical protein